MIGLYELLDPTTKFIEPPGTLVINEQGWELSICLVALHTIKLYMFEAFERILNILNATSFKTINCVFINVCIAVHINAVTSLFDET